MKSIARLKEQARLHEQKEEWDKAIQAYEQALRLSQEEDGEPELQLFNRIGDLHLRRGRHMEAVRCYEEAADKYADAGFYNNAIALCNKALRYAPDRAELYRKLGRYSGAQGFLTDARRYFLEFAERKRKAGAWSEAFGALDEFADLADDAELREMLAERLEAHGEVTMAVAQLRRAYELRLAAGETSEAEAIASRIRKLDPGAELPSAPPAPAVPDDAEADAPDAPDGGALPGLELETAADSAGIEALDPSPDPAPEPPPLDYEGALELPTLDEPDDAPSAPMPAPDEPDDATSDPMPTLVEPEDPAPDPLPSLVEPEIPAPDAPPSLVEPVDLELDPMPASVEPGDAMLDPLPALIELDEDAADPLSGLEDGGEELDEPLPVLEGLGGELVDDPAEDEASAALERARSAALSGAAAQALGELEAIRERLSEAGVLEGALDVVDTLVERAADHLPAHQLRAELAARTGDRERIVAALLGLADCLDRGGARSKAEAVFEQILELDPTNERARAALSRKSSDEAYVDLGTFITDDLLDGASGAGTDEDADFTELLSRFEAKVAGPAPEGDPTSHYDLGLAFKEMGLIEEAIREFQRALDLGAEQLKVYEELGQCFIHKEEYALAAKILERALKVPRSDDRELLGVYYHLGCCHEALGSRAEARAAFERVVELGGIFRDVAERLARL